MTLQDMRDNGDSITLHCHEYLPDLGRYCVASWEPGFEQMIQYFGLDFEIAAERKRFLSMFECPQCGAPAATLIWSINAPGMHRNAGG